MLCNMKKDKAPKNILYVFHLILFTGQCPNYRQYSSSGGAVSSIFDDLTTVEVLNVVQYMKLIKCFNIQDSQTTADINSSYIYLIELRPPKKAEALLYFEGHGPKPGRHARVVIYRCAVSSIYSVLFQGLQRRISR